MVSVIVPVYKSERTLRRCVESLKAQTEEELEVILVDDGSPDQCPLICDSLAREDGRIRVIHKENGGVSSARNEGIRAAQGAYVAFVDSDDYVEPDYCRSMREALEQTGGKLAVCGYHHHYVGADVEKIPKRDMELLDLYGSGFLNMPWNKLFLREGLGSFPEQLSLGEDLLFNLEYLRWCRRGAGGGRTSWLAVIEQPLHHYIQEESGQTLSSQKRVDKLALAKGIRQEAERFFLEEGAWEKRVLRVVDTRFLCECLDDIERLPFDREQTRKEKRALIRDLCRDGEVRKACCLGAPGALDYRILQWSLGHGLVGATYILSVLRSLAVRAKRRLSGRRNGGLGERESG